MTYANFVGGIDISKEKFLRSEEFHATLIIIFRFDKIRFACGDSVVTRSAA